MLIQLFWPDCMQRKQFMHDQLKLRWSYTFNYYLISRSHYNHNISLCVVRSAQHLGKYFRENNNVRKYAELPVLKTLCPPLNTSFPNRRPNSCDVLLHTRGLFFWWRMKFN